MKESKLLGRAALPRLEPPTVTDPPQYSSLVTRSTQVRAGAVLVTALMTLAYAVNFMNQGIILVVAEQIKVDYALTNSQLGFVLGLSYMLFSALGALPLGRVADMHSRSLIVGASLTLMGIATALTSLAHSYWQMITFRALAGTGDAGVLPGAVSMIKDHVSVNRRPLALSVFNAGAAIGALFVYLVMGYVAQLYGWRTAYLWVGILGAVVGIGVHLALPDRHVGAASRAADANSIKAMLRLLAIGPYCHVVLAFIALGMTSAATWNWISPVMQRTYGFSVAQAGTLLGLGSGISTVLGSLFFGVVASHLRQRSAAGPVAAALCMQIGSAVCFTVGLSSDSVWLMMSCIAAGYFFAGAGMVTVFSTIQEVVPSDSCGMAVGFAVLLFSLLGQGLGPLVTGVATDALTAQYGNDALRVVMQLAMVVGTAWICIHLMFVARALHAAKR
jgi:MFS family permease